MWLLVAVCASMAVARHYAYTSDPGSLELSAVVRPHVLLTTRQDRLRAELFDELQPVELPGCRMERIGAARESGYLMCGNLLNGATAGYSYGIGAADPWSCDISRRLDVPVHQYDCFDPGRPSCPGGRTVFHDECVAPARAEDDGRLFDTIAAQMARNGDAARRVVMKMDIEGAEWGSLLHAPDAVLERIDQLAIELHGVGRPEHVAAVRRLKRFFHVANVHFNNYTCMNRIDPFPAAMSEVLFVSKRLVTAAGPRPRGPHPLDVKNAPDRPDCQEPVSRWAGFGGRFIERIGALAFASRDLQSSAASRP